MPKGNPEGYYGSRLRASNASFGGPRQKLLRTLRASGVSDSAATALANEAFQGTGSDSASAATRKKKRSKGLREAIISRLRSIGEKARQAVMR